MARKNLLEELSHDLRTPLTSLNTSIETLYDHGAEMPAEEQHEFISMMKTELGYFLHLIEDLFFIAAIGEPRYKKTTERIHLTELLSNEIKTRDKTARSQGSLIQWKIAFDEAPEAKATLLGDPLLIQRLFKNALDNAAKHARTEVVVRLLTLESALDIHIENDGDGITDHEIACFGQRRKNRFQASETQQGASLGLGSVIMRTILELHGGTLDVQRKSSGSGTVLNIKLPLHISITQRTVEK
jgi:K+-sensing histidine kinase KdpD